MNIPPLDSSRAGAASAPLADAHPAPAQGAANAASRPASTRLAGQSALPARAAGQADSFPREIWANVGGYSDWRTRSACRLVSKTVASGTAAGVVPPLRLPLHGYRDLMPAIGAYPLGSIPELVAVDCLLSDRQAMRLADPNRVSIPTLNLHNNDIRDDGARALAANTSIRSLDLSFNLVSDQGGGVQALAASTTLKTLNLNHNNHIGLRGMQSLAANTSITSLSLALVGLDDAHAAVLATNTVLESLVLRNNRIGDAGALALAANRSITSLDLRGNTITDVGALVLLANESITSLDLRDNQIGPVGRAALEAERSRFHSLEF